MSTGSGRPVFKPNLQARRTRSQSRSADQQAQVNDAESCAQSVPDHDNNEGRDEGQTIIFGGIATENGAKDPPTPRQWITPIHCPVPQTKFMHHHFLLWQNLGLGIPESP
jgi:hypothetical protein